LCALQFLDVKNMHACLVETLILVVELVVENQTFSLCFS